MRNISRLASGLFILAAVAAPTTAAHAQSLRTWVSGTGSDGNACTRAAPCLTFNHAHAVTAAGGEINCVDAGDFGPVVIAKAISIDCSGVPALGNFNFCVLGTCSSIIVQAGASDVVRLRGLALSGANVDDSGIRFISGAALHVRNCVIGGYTNGTPGLSGIGIFFTPQNGATAKLFVEDTIISGNGLSASGGGIVIQPAGSGSARVELHRTVLENNTYGLFANGTGSTGLIAVQVRDSVVTGSAFNGISAFTSAGQSTTSITVDHTASTLNGSNGILAQGANAFVLLKDATVMSNGTGLSAVSGGNIFSYQNNALTGNVSDGAATAVLTLK